MAAKLFLLDGMALVYRAHFAFIRNPIFNSKGQNTSALYGFANTILDIIGTQKPDYLAVAMDTPEPTARHEVFPDYKAQREEMPEDIAFSLPHIDRLAAGFRIPVLKYPGFEADDIIGTLARRAEDAGVQTFMVTPDKDFAQLVSPRVLIYKPSRQGTGMEMLGVEEVKAQWNVQEPSQVADVLGLWGDSSDNIPGIPGFGEKTAKALIGQYGTIENLIAHADELKGKQQERVKEFGEQALLCKKLATISRDVPVREALDDLRVSSPDETALKSLFIEFEFNSLGRRLFGEEFKAGRGTGVVEVEAPPGQQSLFDLDLKDSLSVPHRYDLHRTLEDCRALAGRLAQLKEFCLDTETDSLDPKAARLVGLSFSWHAHEGCFLAFPRDRRDAEEFLEILRPVLSDAAIGKTGHNLKFDLSVLRWNGVEVRGRLFDTMIAHHLVDPDRRHGMDDLSEQYLGYTPIPLAALIGDKKTDQISLWDVDVERVAEYSAEDADVTWQLREKLEPLLKDTGQEEVFYEIEMPLLPVLVDMEYEGITLDPATLEVFSRQLDSEIERLQARIYELAGCTFNLNSPKQMGEILFERLRLGEKAKKTRTGQYATHERILASLASRHEIVRCILDYRENTKLKSTYVEALPRAVHPRSGRVHTTYSQTGAATGRLASYDPNLQNIPIRTELGQEIRKAFIPRGPEFELLSADYSQIELRIMADMSGDPGLTEAFRSGLDIHAATAANVYGLPLAEVTPEMRRRAKMVNFGIIYGISAFGLADRLGIPRAEAAALIEQYFKEYPGVQTYMSETVSFAREHGYVETRTGRRRVIRDIQSANQTTRGAAERMAINTPIQGTAADMIKLAMVRIQSRLRKAGARTRLLLQVHDELVFDLAREERDTVLPMVEHEMKDALPLRVPVVVELGTGANWLDAH